MDQQVKKIRMSLTPEEVDVVQKYRAKKAKEAAEAALAKKRAECEHDPKYDFRNYKTDYFKCTKCGQQFAGYPDLPHLRKKEEPKHEPKNIDEIDCELML